MIYTALIVVVGLCMDRPSVAQPAEPIHVPAPIALRLGREDATDQEHDNSGHGMRAAYELLSAHTRPKPDTSPSHSATAKLAE